MCWGGRGGGEWGAADAVRAAQSGMDRLHFRQLAPRCPSLLLMCRSHGLKSSLSIALARVNRLPPPPPPPFRPCGCVVGAPSKQCGAGAARGCSSARQRGTLCHSRSRIAGSAALAQRRRRVDPLVLLWRFGTVRGLDRRHCGTGAEAAKDGVLARVALTARV